MATGKQDVKKESLWRRTIQQQAASGLSVRAWCRKRGVKESAFYWWRKELARRDAQTQAASFVSMDVSEDRPEDGEPRIEIMLVDGRRIQITGTVNRQTLTDVLEVLTSVNSVEPERRAC